MKIRINLILGATLVSSLLVPMTSFAGTWGGSKPKWTYTESQPTTWKQIDGKWYYFDSNNQTFTGNLIIGDKWYYLNPENGVMLETSGYPLIVNITIWIRMVKC